MTRPFRRSVSRVVRAYSHDPLDRIAEISGTNADHSRWSLSQAAAITSIEAGTAEFVFQAQDQMVRLTVLTRGGEKYLQSEREKTHPDDLLYVLARGR